MLDEGSALRVLFVSAEIFPFAKEGGLADVAGALPKALSELGCDIRAIMPLYGNIDRKTFEIEPLEGAPELKIPMGSRSEAATLYRATLPGSDLTVILVGNERYFGRGGVYNDPATGEGYPDNAERFIFFQKAVIAFLRSRKWRPRVIHCNDFHTGLIPFYLQQNPDGPARRPATILTIHNLAYQGVEPVEILPVTEIPPEQFYPLSPFEFYGKVNMMKVGIVFADLINTVSPTYAEEIQSGPKYGFGLEGVLRSRATDLFGIVNGIDYSVWNPETDDLIPYNFSASDLSGKAKNKRELLKRFKLPTADDRAPLIGIVSRLAEQKGFDILGDALARIMKSGAQMVVLGTGKREYHEMLEAAARRFPRGLGVRLAFDNGLAHLIEAGADIFLMPSRFEPCGLNQLYSLRYGTIPVVRATGGLADTIEDFDPGEGSGTGFVFKQYSPGALLKAVERAAGCFRDEEAWSRLVRNAMAKDFSWRASAEKYIGLYRRAIENTGFQ